jgi:hypothetical protein
VVELVDDSSDENVPCLRVAELIVSKSEFYEDCLPNSIALVKAFIYNYIITVHGDSRDFSLIAAKRG